MIHITNQINACCLIALDALFHGDYPGKQFLEELYEECFQSEGINSQYYYLLEESAPVKVLCPEGKSTSIYRQGDSYWTFIDWQLNIRYRLPYTQECIVVYVISPTSGHAVCVRAMYVNEFIRDEKLHALIVPTRGLIIDTPIKGQYHET